MQLSDNVLSTILEESSFSFLRKVNGFCRLTRNRFLQEGAYFANSWWVEDYFNYLLTHDKYDLFVNFVDGGHLLCEHRDLQTKEGEKIIFCYVNRAKAPEKSKIAAYLNENGVYMDCSCATRRCYIP